jgi:PST family polysaccharide transporter
MINFIVAIILARLLDPRDFGLVALAMLLMQASNLFTGLGMGQAIIHSKQQHSKTAFPSFVIVMLVGLIFFCSVQIGSDLLAGLMGDRLAAPVLRILAFLILLNGLSLIPLSLLRRELRFAPIAVAQIVSQIVFGLSAISLAYLGYGYWSIIYANLLNTLTSTVIYWIGCSDKKWFMPKPWEWPVVKELLRYGLQTTTNGVVTYVHMHIDDWLVGRMLGTQALGFYSQAYDFSNSTIGNLSKNVIANVFFPSYARIQDDKDRLARAYLKSVNLVLLLMTPMAFGIMAAAPEIVSVVLGAKWLPIVPVLQVYAFMILTEPISENCAPLFQAVGLPNYNVRAGFVLLGVMLPLMVFLLPQGIVGIALAVVAAHWVGALFNLYQMNMILPGTARQTVWIAMPILIVGVMMLIGVNWAKPLITTLLGNEMSIAALSLILAVGAVIYLTASTFTQWSLLREVFAVFVSSLPLKKRVQQLT